MSLAALGLLAPVFLSGAPQRLEVSLLILFLAIVAVSHARAIRRQRQHADAIMACQLGRLADLFIPAAAAASSGGGRL